ncbi:MAG: hypothetical protein SangKO_061800 [Sandaracinaceae bacterium]
MKLDEVTSHLSGIPFTSPWWGRILYEHVLRERPERCLELGFAHGTSTCYIAAALEEVGGPGRVTAVDRDRDISHSPTLEELLEQTGLSHRVDVVREPGGYNWFLKRMIAERSSLDGCLPLYDFCFIDGPKNWNVDGLAFFLVDKLLREGATLLFDDYGWTYEAHQLDTGYGDTDDIQHSELTSEQRAEPQIKAVFELLVMQHPSYGEFRVQDDRWAWARKTSASPTRRVETSVDLDARLLTKARTVLRELEHRARAQLRGRRWRRIHGR